ncbi:hypothetical protein [Chromobacterium haemolyticum]|uniref:hypothetical protein n=1 Tax=Chromobacterium haemolyticum TaxID=394935 RepID=UPI00244CBDD0|nr:hypothetical protein [Chromobacterium haemolyticum]MDH0343606.1 hypothetical protein [Chromobacterium haemolyticum]
MYRLTKQSDGVIRVADGAYIPKGHRWWDEYELWRQQGNQPEPQFVLGELQEQLLRDIDVATDVARNETLGSELRLAEYQRAAAEAQAFKDAGYKGEAPPAVRSWAEAKGWDGQQAADSILAKAAACEQALYAIRDARLKGKEAVRQASDETAARTAADEAVSQLRQLAAGDFAAAAPEAEAGRAGGLFKFFSKRL